MSGDPTGRLSAASCSNGAPSARNLLVTVFGDALLPHGDDIAVSVRSLTDLLASFGVNERLIRTSLSRLVNDGLLEVVSDGRRSFYAVAPQSRSLFRTADARIYGRLHPAWDGSWTVVIIDAAEATAERRAELRSELGWTGLGVVAPNVMASPVVSATDAADTVSRVGGFTNVVVSRSQIVERDSTISGDELARRCVDLDAVEQRYIAFVDEFDSYASIALRLEPPLAFKLRTLLVASYRRIVLADPSLPAELLPEGWIGARARRTAAAVYDRCAESAEDFMVSTVETRHGRHLVADPDWLHGRFHVPT